jgi:hypothetical protein
LIFLVFLLIAEPCEGQGPARSGKAQVPSCTRCHKDFASLLSQGHPRVLGKDITACLSCHIPNPSARPQPKPFSARIHRAHVKGDVKIHCTECHTWSPGKSLGLPKQTVSFGKVSKDQMDLFKQIFSSWSGSRYMDALHASMNITCAGCHGDTLPDSGDTVENDRCLGCHGSIADLAAKTTPKDTPARNPHKSHLREIACTVCHHGHRVSEVYCLGCHTNFIMKIPGGGNNTKYD